MVGDSPHNLYETGNGGQERGIALGTFTSSCPYLWPLSYNVAQERGFVDGNSSSIINGEYVPSSKRTWTRLYAAQAKRYGNATLITYLPRYILSICSAQLNVCLQVRQPIGKRHESTPPCHES